MFERFNEPAKHAVTSAQHDAMEFGRGYIGTEHLLLGLLTSGDGHWISALEALEVDIKALRPAVLARLNQ